MTDTERTEREIAECSRCNGSGFVRERSDPGNAAIGTYPCPRCNPPSTERTKDYAEVVRHKMARDPELKAAIETERELADLQTTVYELTEIAERAVKEMRDAIKHCETCDGKVDCARCITFHRTVSLWYKHQIEHPELFKGGPLKMFNCLFGQKEVEDAK